MASTITALRVRPGRRGQVQLFLDGREALNLAAVLAAELAVGQSLSEEEVERLRERDAEEEAVQQGMRLLARRPRSEHELRDYYRRRRTPDTIQETALSRLREAGLMNDAAFAQFWVENRQAFRPKSAAALRAELRRKGIDADIIRPALAGLDEQAAAEQAARQGARRLTVAPEDEFRRRLTGYLARRGFDYTIIRPVVDRLWKQRSGRDAESED